MSVSFERGAIADEDNRDSVKRERLAFYDRFSDFSIRRVLNASRFPFCRSPLSSPVSFFLFFEFMGNLFRSLNA